MMLFSSCCSEIWTMCSFLMLMLQLAGKLDEECSIVVSLTYYFLWTNSIMVYSLQQLLVIVFQVDSPRSRVTPPPTYSCTAEPIYHHFYVCTSLPVPASSVGNPAPLVVPLCSWCCLVGAAVKYEPMCSFLMRMLRLAGKLDEEGGIVISVT